MPFISNEPIKIYKANVFHYNRISHRILGSTIFGKNDVDPTKIVSLHVNNKRTSFRGRELNKNFHDCMKSNSSIDHTTNKTNRTRTRTSINCEALSLEDGTIIINILNKIVLQRWMNLNILFFIVPTNGTALNRVTI